MSITQNLERSYNLFIEQDDSLAFFRGMAEYADYILTTPVLKDVVDKNIAERNTLYTKIETIEKKSLEEMEVAKRKLFTIIKRKNINTDSFTRFVTHGYGDPLIKNAIDDLEAYDKKIISKSGWQSDILEHCLFDICVNIKALGYVKEIKKFIVSTDDYTEYYQRINGPSEFTVSGNENGTFIFSQTWPDRFQTERLLKNERQLKPWGAFETLVRFKEAYDTISKDESLTSILQNNSGNLSDIKDGIEIIFMATDLEKLIENESRYRHSPANIELSHLNKRMIKTQMQTVHNRLMRKAIEQDNFSKMMEKDIDEQNRKRQSYVVQEAAAPFFPIKLGVPYNPNPEPTLVRVVGGEVSVQGLKEGLEKISKSHSGGVNISNKFPHKIPSGTRWENFIIEFLDDENILVRVKNIEHKTNYKEMKLTGRGKNAGPSELWIFLKVLSQVGGELKVKDSEARNKYKKQKELLAKALQDYFSIEYDPFFPYHSCPEKRGNSYKIKMTLIPATLVLKQEVVTAKKTETEEFFNEQTSQ